MLVQVCSLGESLENLGNVSMVCDISYMNKKLGILIETKRPFQIYTWLVLFSWGRSILYRGYFNAWISFSIPACYRIVDHKNSIRPWYISSFDCFKNES